MRQIIQIALFASFCIFLPSYQVERFPDLSVKELLKLEEETFEAVNKYRKKKGLSELKTNSILQEIAREHSMKMAQGVRALGHRGWDERADLIFDKLEVGMLAENIGFNQGRDEPAAFVLKGWIGSNQHRDNIKGEDFDITGIGVGKSSDGAYYFTQIFAAYLD